MSGQRAFLLDLCSYHLIRQAKTTVIGMDMAEGPSCQVANTCTFIITVDMCVVVMLSADWTRDTTQEIYRLGRLNFPFV